MNLISRIFNRIPGFVAVYQKQTADGYVAQCAQRHEKGEFADALDLCTAALAIYMQLNEYTTIIPGLKDGLFWADVAQTTVNLYSPSIL